MKQRTTTDPRRTRRSAPVDPSPTADQAQLRLVPADTPWRLDPTTRRVGRQGVATAREALAAARRRGSQESATHDQAA